MHINHGSAQAKPPFILFISLISLFEKRKKKRMANETKRWITARIVDMYKIA